MKEKEEKEKEYKRVDTGVAKGKFDEEGWEV